MGGTSADNFRPGNLFPAGIRGSEFMAQLPVMPVVQIQTVLKGQLFEQLGGEWVFGVAENFDDLANKMTCQK